MPKGIPIDELDTETRQRLGIASNLGDEDVDRKLPVLGIVLRALKGLRNSDALWILKQAQSFFEVQKVESHDDQALVLLKPPVPGQNPPITWIIHLVATYFQMGPDDLIHRGRKQQTVLARQIAMYVLYRSNQYSLQKIGDELGGRSPATVSHGFMTVAAAMRGNSSLQDTISEITEQIHQLKMVISQEIFSQV